jgi:formamidopyrimidine-DNA glycosylase
MPELPEVEALRRSLLPYVKGRKVKNIKVLQDKIIAGKGTKRIGTKENTLKFIKNITGKKIIDIKRRAKNLIIVLNDKSILLVHLKMTGQLVFVGSDKKPIHGGHPIQESENKLPHKHTYIIFELDNGTLYYNDVRQFGYVLYYENENILNTEKHFDGIGIEPFDKEFTLPYFQNEIEKLKVRKIKTPIKKILLDQKIVVGCGNIYCDEVLWTSSVLPTRPISQLSKPEINKIYINIINILDKAINSGGSSVANYLLANGKRGNYADYHNVYQKTGSKCRKKNCNGIIKKINFAGRGTHFCPKHQK